MSDKHERQRRLEADRERRRKLREVPDLAAFLRARLDEDEAFASARLEGLPEEFVGDLTPTQSLAMHMLRGVAAKQAILTAYIGDGPQDYSEPPQYWQALGFAVSHLAAVYSEHPDYRQEWKP